MARQILFVPGKHPKPASDIHRAQLWRCLLAGVAKSNVEVASAMKQEENSFRLASWNSLYYGCDKSAEPDIPWIEKLINKQAADELDRQQALSWKNKVKGLMPTIGDLFPSLIRYLPIEEIRDSIAETARYFSNTDGVACEIRELIKAPLRDMFSAGDRVLLIGHSMGSIVAYDSLWELSHESRDLRKVELFLTLGSPLGTRFVQRRLQGGGKHGTDRYPLNIRNWTNVVAVGDLVPVDPTVADDFREMIKLGVTSQIEDRVHGVYNYFRNEEGLNVHRSYGYLVNHEIGKIVADWWLNNA